MDKIASELLVERLAEWGVDTVFGLPGDGINGLMEGFRRHQDQLRFLLVQHEEAAAFMPGKVKYQQAGKRHGMIKRTNKQIRNHRGTNVLFKSDGDNIIKFFLPNS